MSKVSAQSPEVIRRKLVDDTGASLVGTGFGETVEDVLQNSRTRMKPRRHVPPVGLGYVPPFSIYSNVDGSISTSLDVAQYRYKNNGAYCWIDPSKADNSGDGLTPATAKRDLSLVLGSSTTYDTIFIVPNALIDRDVVKGWGGALSASKNIICVGGRAKITRRFAPVSWTNTGGGIFSCARSGVYFCWDTTILDNYGDYALMPEVASVGALSAAASGFYTDGTTLWVKRVDLAQPTIVTTAIFLQEGTGNGSAIIRGDITVYFENIDFEGGYASVHAQSTAAGQKQKYIAKNCTYGYSYSEDGFSCFGTALIMHQGCIAKRNVKDGFNYHNNVAYGESGVFVEVDCDGWRNGITQYGTSENNRNGSTAHDGYLGVRVNGSFFETKGPIIADVDGAKTWNVGVAAYDSQGAAVDQKCAFFVGGGGAGMWLDRCWGYGSDEAVVVGVGCVMYKKESFLEGEQRVFGSLVDY